MNARVISFADLPTDSPMPLIDRQRIIADNMMVSRVVLHKGFRVERHQHENEQIGIVLSGRVKFLLGEPGTASEHEEVLVGGQAIVLPPNVPHGAEAIEETVILDLFSPPSEKTGIDQG
ncbi:MAG: cupin domain-containing protein [Phycisphaerales bacterium]|nr:cupin domain-containing protein [Phycisphaerales bacterium]MCB9835305.1 cupin domain-containing protein [Phycisphaera sp.]